MYALSLDFACNYEICPFIVILSPFKRFPIQNGCFYNILNVHLMDEMENNTFAPRLHIVYLKCTLVSAAACASANHTLNNGHSSAVYRKGKQLKILQQVDILANI